MEKGNILEVQFRYSYGIPMEPSLRQKKSKRLSFGQRKKHARIGKMLSRWIAGETMCIVSTLLSVWGIFLMMELEINAEMYSGRYYQSMMEKISMIMLRKKYKEQQQHYPLLWNDMCLVKMCAFGIAITRTNCAVCIGSWRSFGH